MIFTGGVNFCLNGTDVPLFQTPWRSSLLISYCLQMRPPQSDWAPFTRTLGFKRHGPPSLAEEDIDFKELFAILAAAMTWGAAWTGRRIVFITDNKPITQIWEKGNTPARNIMHLVRKLFLFAAEHDFSVSLKHILGHYNCVADALSRFQGQKFRRLAPQADRDPTPIPADVWLLGNHLERHSVPSN